MNRLVTTDVLLRPFFILIILFSCNSLVAQKKDTTKRENRLLNQMLEMITKDTTVKEPGRVERIDKEFLPFSGFVIRNIYITRLPFGTALTDTTKRSENTLTKIANKLHHLTRIKVIENNLFFHVKDTINPYLMADNEKYLRELSYLRDADILITPVTSSDSADITVVVKDVFSLGGAIGSLGLKKSDVQIREDNISGSGNAAIVYALYDANRKNDLAFGGELIRRNIGGSFIDQKIGYQSYYTSLRAPAQENYYYYNLKKPLLTRFMKFTYELDASYHSTTNKYNKDSVYYADFRYRYYQFESWLGYNINGRNFSGNDESKKLRLLAGLRVVTRKFFKIPSKYHNSYNWQFADLNAILGSFTFYRQNFFKGQYIYGFGKTEDIPEGIVFTATGGHTIKQDLSRPYLSVSFQQYGFNKRNNYIDVTLKTEGYLGDHGLEDVNLLGSVNFFDHLKSLNPKWKQRFFLGFSAAKQIRTLLNEPLFLNSDYGLPYYGRDYTGGDTRISGNAESVFFSPWSLAAFRFAPLLFFNVTAFQPYDQRINLYASTGGGIRARNESLIFGTIEIKGIYFPGKNYYGEHFGLELSTNIIFKYNNQFLKKPDFIQIN